MHPLIAALSSRHGLPTVDAATVDTFLAPAAGEAEHAILFFTGDPETRSDTTDVAVVLPELLAAFAGRFRAAVVDRDAEEALKARFGVQVFPSLAVTRGQAALGVMPRIRDWSDYTDTLAGYLKVDAEPPKPARPKIEITYNGRRTDA